MAQHLTLVTAASQNHFRSLKQFLRTVPPQTPCWVYDIGLSAESWVELQTEFTSAHFHWATFNFAAHPDYFRLEAGTAGQYAWKPAIIAEVANKTPTSHCLLWCDAGNMIVGNLHTVEAIIRAQGIYSPISAGTVKQWTHRGMLDFLEINEYDKRWGYMFDASPRNGAILGFHLANPAVLDFIQKFDTLAHRRDCIAPAGSDRSNHRQDQALFTLMYYRFTGGAPLLCDRVAITCHNDID